MNAPVNGKVLYLSGLVRSYYPLAISVVDALMKSCPGMTRERAKSIMDGKEGLTSDDVNALEETAYEKKSSRRPEETKLPLEKEEGSKPGKKMAEEREGKSSLYGVARRPPPPERIMNFPTSSRAPRHQAKTGAATPAAPARPLQPVGGLLPSVEVLLAVAQTQTPAFGAKLNVIIKASPYTSQNRLGPLFKQAGLKPDVQSSLSAWLRGSLSYTWTEAHLHILLQELHMSPAELHAALGL